MCHDRLTLHIVNKKLTNLNCFFIWELAKYLISRKTPALKAAAGDLCLGGRFVQLEVFAPTTSRDDSTAVKGAFSFSCTALVELASAAILLSAVSCIANFIYVFGLQFETHRLGIRISFREFFTRRSSFHFIICSGCLSG